MKIFSHSGIMMGVIAVLLAISGGLSASVPAVNPKIWVITPKVTVVQNMLHLFNNHQNNYGDADSVLSAGEAIKFEGIMRTINQINYRIEQLINKPKLARLNDDALVEYKKAVENKAIQQLLNEKVISYKEIEAQLRYLHEHGSDKLYYRSHEHSEEILHFIEQLSSS